MSQVLSLFHHKPSSSSEVPGFVLFESQRDLSMYRFSPHLMQLDDNLYVADLQPTRSYWRNQAKRQGESVRDLLRRVAEASGQKDSFFIFCDHPFRGYLFLQSLVRRQTQSQCVFMDTAFAHKNYGNISWQDWLWAVRKLEAWWESRHQLVRERQQFSTQMGRLERFLSRMGLELISDLKDAQFYEVGRRFQQFLGMTWRWTFEKAKDSKESSGSQQSFLFFEEESVSEKLLDFPWEPFHLFEPPVRENLLEFPLSLWDQIQEELKKDLEILCEHQGLRPPFQVMRFLWTIVLYDGDTCRSPVEFNYPLCLHQDREQGFAVTLKQLSFCFDQLKHQLMEKAKESDFMNMPFVLGWNLRASHIVYNKRSNTSLFPEVRAQQTQQQDLMELQNKLKSPICTYQAHPSHVPSWDFSEKRLDESVEEPEGLEFLGHLKRPLFLFHHPLPLEASEIRQKRFLERTSSAWWHSKSSEDHFRDYYICELTSGDIVWGFKDFKGDWFKHGLYS